jgi:hypothetical protein
VSSNARPQSFVFLFRFDSAAQREALGTPELAQKSLQRWLDWIRELESNGHLRDPGQPLAVGGKVVRGGNPKSVTDGPYIEVKDFVAGFIIVEARDLDEAVTLASGCPILEGDGSVEVRAVGTLDI